MKLRSNILYLFITIIGVFSCVFVEHNSSKRVVEVVLTPKAKVYSKEEIFPKEPYEDVENSLCFRVTGKGLKEPSYLYGTLHVIDRKDFKLPKKILKVLQGCGQLVLEILNSDLDHGAKVRWKQVNSWRIRLALIVYAKKKYPNFSYLKIYKLLNKNFSLINQKFKEMTKRTNYISEWIWVGFDNGYTHPIDMEVELERLYMDKNKQSTIKLMSLDDHDETIGVYTNYRGSRPYNDELNDYSFKGIITSTLLNLKDEKHTKQIKFNRQAYKIYLDQETAKLRVIEELYSQNYSEREYFIISVREKIWLQKIPRMMRQGSSFIAVGVSHIAALVEGLRKKGYKVEPYGN